MLDYNDIKTRINKIVAIGDTVKASAEILELNDVITQSESEDTAKYNEYENIIKSKDEEIKNLRQDNNDIRQANADIVIKYGELLNRQPIDSVEKKKPDKDDDDDDKPLLSWDEIAKLK